MKLNLVLLGHLVQSGLVMEDSSNGSWDWTDTARHDVDPHVLLLLATLLYGHAIPHHDRAAVKRAGFDPDTGFVVTELD